MRTKEFVYAFAPDCRRRQIVRRSQRTILGFVVQLECFAAERWHPILRFDTAHGFAHRDVLHPDGRVEKTPLPAYDFNEALTLAEEELRRTWEQYRDQFLKELRRHEP